VANPRVHEIAAELGVDSKVALDKLKELGEYVKGSSSSIAPPVARKLRAALEAEGVAKPAAAAPAPAPKPAPKPGRGACGRGMPDAPPGLGMPWLDE